MLIDNKQRSLATDPTQSFIVQAPAGSGKTEILTQRYLRLLGRVTAPEQIVALTFTRKAASEMRERIILALQLAAQNQQASSPHQQMTLNFAHEALRCNALYQWDLLNQSGRLKIITIDSLCQSINQAIPLLEKQIAYSKITEKAERHYLNAGRRCVQFAMETTEYQSAIKTLLLHVDNRLDKLLELFTGLLAARDQWLAPLFQAKTQDKASFELALAYIEEHELTRLRNSLPGHVAQDLISCAQELATIENNPDSPRFPLKDWFSFHMINKEVAKALSKLLLTGDDNFRKSFDHHVGLLSSSCPTQEYKRLKEASKVLLAELNEYPEFLDALLQVKNLPDPEYDLAQWEVLQALFLLLPLLVSHLHVLFAEANEVDFTTIAQQALDALGEPETPTDLALYLDNAIHHLLVDEFQDTSISQFELLSRLIDGWQRDDGRTLFIVGDPMQSIYRFRQAEVGLFFRAQEQGIGPVKLNVLELQCNFRSQKPIVDWVNTQFAQIFPSTNDIECGAVSFHASVNVIDKDEHSEIQAIQFQDREQEVQGLIRLIQTELELYPQQSMAILVRSRTQLAAIIRLLRLHQIPYQGTDITLLANLSHLRDIWALTQALLSPGNRLSWLCLLRSPYCGLTLADIHAIASFNKKKCIYSALLQLNKITELSKEGFLRANFFIRVMHKALTQRYTGKLSAWILKTLKALHAEQVLNQNQFNDLEQFWTLLDSYEQDGRLADTNEFLQELNKLYAQQTISSPLQIMTIHKSKGLEFDTVFLPGLGTQPNRGNNPLLRWLKLPTEKNGSLLLMSPLKGAHQEFCPVYDYLSQIDEVKGHYEMQRLLYVAVTRAKARLYLMDHGDKITKNSFRNLLKNQEFSEYKAAICAEDNKIALPQLFKLPLHHYENQLADPNDNFLNPPVFSLSTNLPRLIGVVTHRLLQWICDNHPTNQDDIPWSMVTYEFKKLGFDSKVQNEALKMLQEQIKKLYQDPIGLWIIAPHNNERNEYELLVEHHGQPATRIIDRTFEDNNKRWIIDFKTGKEDESSLEKHRCQLNEYGFYLLNQTPLPIHCGVYYLASNHWNTWKYTSLIQENIDS